MIDKVIITETGKTFTSKDGREYKGTMFYLVLKNGNKIAIKPVFDDGYTALRLIAEKDVK